jgi:2-hydroxychromene-2-carboxylate isomerase
MSSPLTSTCGLSRRIWAIPTSRSQEPDAKAKLLANTQDAVERGTFGSPTFFVGNEMYYGKEQLRDIEDVYAK